MSDEPIESPAVRRLTPREGAVLDYIVASVDERGFPPTIAEIGLAVDLSSLSSVTYVLRSLELKGWISRPLAGSPRAITVRRRPQAVPS